MRKKLSLIAGILILVLFSVVVAGCGGKQEQEKKTSAPAEKIVLKLADSLPVSHIMSVQGGQYWMKRVEELTNGKVQIKHYPAEQLGKAKDLLDLTRAGTTDLAYIGPAYVAGKLPLCGAVELPGLFNDSVVASKAFYKLAQGILYEQEFKKQGVYPLMAWVLPPYQVLNTKRPVKSLSDMKGLKLRVAGGSIEETAALTGAVPISMPPPEMFEAIQRGTLDGTLLAYISAKPYKLEELIKYGTVGANFGTFAGTYCINEEVWQKLPEDVKNAMKKAAVETVENLARALVEEDNKVLKDWEKQGKELYFLKPEEQKDWSEKLQPVIESWIKAMENKGLPAKQVVAEFKKALQESK